MSSGDSQEALIPGKSARVPRWGGGVCRKWEEIGNDTPGLPPPLAGGQFTLQPLPEIHDPHPTTQLKQEVGDEAFVTQIT